MASIYAADFFDQSDPVQLEQALPSRSRARDRVRDNVDVDDELRRCQETIASLRRACEQHQLNEDTLGKDILDITHRYLQVQSEKDILENRAKTAEEEVRRLRALLQTDGDGDGFGLDAEMGSLGVVGSVGMHYAQNMHRHSQTTLSSGSGSGSGVVDIDYDGDHQSRANDPQVALPHSASSSLSPQPLPLLTVSVDVPALIRHLNFQTLSLATSATASASLRQGAREPALRTEHLRALSDRLGCVFVQILTDHHKSAKSKNKGEMVAVEVAIQALLCWHIHWVVSEWPNHHQIGDEVVPLHSSSNSTTADILTFRKTYTPLVSRATHDIAALLSLSGAPGSVEDIHKRQLDRIGDTIQVLFKSSEALASELHSHACVAAEKRLPAPAYKVIYERPGGGFKKELMHSRPWSPSANVANSFAATATAHLAPSPPSLATHPTSPSLLSMSRWKPPSPTKSKAKGGSADARILCTRELGLLRCLGVGVRGQGERREEVMVKAIVLFEGDFER